MKSPAFQFYPTDYLGSQRVQMLTLEEEGAYMRLLCSCWQHGSIPADPELASRLIGKGASTTLATVVLAMFTPGSEPGRLIHDRLEAERSKQAEWREKSAAGGRASAEARAKSKGGSRVVEPPYQPKGNTPSSVFCLLSSSPDVGGKRSAAASPASDEDWLKSLEADPTYHGISVRTEFGKMNAWCSANRKQPNRRRFVNWLNRCDRPMNGTAAPARIGENLR